MRTLIIAMALAFIFVDADFSSAQGKKYPTPRDVFDAAKTASAKKDFQSLSTCFTDESFNGMAGGMIFVGSLVKAFAKFDKTGKGQEAAKEIDAIFEKHGITDEKLKGLKLNFGKDPEAANKALQEVGRMVKDRVAFISDMAKLMERQGKAKDNLFDSMATLKNVTESGDSAKGTVSGAKGEKPIHFKKVNGGWRIDLPVEFGPKKGGKGVSAQPPSQSRDVQQPTVVGLVRQPVITWSRSA